MSNIIDSIKLSGTVYTLSAQTSGGGGNPTVELTQAEYDALVSAGTVSADTYYIITDAQAGDLTQYWTSAQTQSAITEATSGKASASDVETLSGTVTGMNATLTAHTADTTIHVTSTDKTTWSGKQDALVSGTNIKTINNESILGSGNITIQGGGGSITIDPSLDSGSTNPVANSAITTAINAKAAKTSVFASYYFGQTNNAPWIRFRDVVNNAKGNEIYYPIINGKGILTNNGTWATNNLQFNLVDTSAITSAITSSSTDAQVPSAKCVYDQLGGLKLLKITQADYDALSGNTDSNTLYVITNS